MSVRTIPLRQVPGDSLVHRLWAGTKLVVVFVLGAMTWVLPSWPALGMVAAVVVITAIIAGIPLGAIPRPPWWFWGLIIAGGLLNVMFGPAALIVYLRAVTLGLVLVASSILVIWTTPMADIAPAIATLMRPLRVFRLPVDEWAVAIALCLRGMPMLIDELRMLRAAHRLRPSAPPRSGHPAAEMGVLDMITAAMSSALRRSSEMAEAITARGGTGRLAAYPSRPGRADAVVLVVVGVACAAAITLTILL
ncbi:energy-coupling factor transporter transmembrane protein EcfT [Gordonia sp. HNM0687]|uniref:Energy-coupling factor transporter transmembrane protein EcfT n=1 Tax=Gordonia mangrovi TaxID=2665643 RepID=A0A6L7GNQ7_9ACTN|nr:energy-coupling factor transporter transmembrane protein EcfT [Gordonia mangrovi]MDY6810275.1 energy-coupling factor transporter transmembrane protein EcfT [Actinomycetota bacterium]MXP21506.1 energy-coupling factor transporter transmembrane protein EcfT [Gordonia mangrovi]UVF80252.1 energy-coupling factor transporter transmembrane protein EcfT [Gordonia mangrovi]